MRAGLFGGAFDPPHIGHLICAQYAMEELALDKVIFIPSGDHPFKGARVEAPAGDRLAMLKLPASGHDAFEVSEIELKRSGTSYMIDTIESMLNEHPDWELYLLIGEDNIKDFRKWRRFEDILNKATVAGMRRQTDREGDNKFIDGIRLLDTPVIEVSSTMIRERVRAGKSICYLVDSKVEEYIKINRLYKKSLMAH